MRTVKRNAFLAGVAAIGGLLLATNMASAEIGSDKSGAILIFPKVVANRALSTDTEIQLSNTAPHQIAVRCFLVNANSHCSNFGVTGVSLVCDDDTACNPTGVTGGHCVAGWQETDFRFTLTPRQPIDWIISVGMPVLPLDGLIKQGPIDPDTGLNAINDGSIPPTPEDPFKGELKCIEVDLASEQPRDGTDAANNFAGDLAGVATIVVSTAADLDARAYNGIGLQATPNARGGDNTLILGGGEDIAEYDGCSNILILDHFFDDAIEPINGSRVRTTLTLIPCSENFLTQDGGRNRTVVQYLVYNEFEQRFSASNSVTCFSSLTLSDLNSRPGLTDDPTSIFNVGVSGTLTGQTRIRPVDGSNQTRGDGLLGVAEEFYTKAAVVRSDAFNIHKPRLAERINPDVIVLP